MSARRFLFLQGVASPFFSALADHLRDQGHAIFRINFCSGDALYWGGRDAWNFRAGAQELPAYMESKFALHAFTDVVLFGDQRPIHRIAIEIALQNRARIHVFEEGYFRPNWFTLERDGVNAASALPTDPAWYRAVDPHLEAPEPLPVQSSLRTRALHDMAYHLANILNPISFPGYRTHRPHNALREYLGWARRFSGAPAYRRRNGKSVRALCATGTLFYLLPLQLNADFQITEHSNFKDMRDVITRVVSSFAANAPDDRVLVIKNHPLDTGLVDYQGLLQTLTKRHQLEKRILYLESGDLQLLLQRALGCITVNSTVGLSALLQGLPVCTLGKSIYNLPGLTHQDGLDSFWCHANHPDAALAKAFKNVVLHTTQVNGDLYTRAGIATAVSHLSPYLEVQSKLDQTFNLDLAAHPEHPQSSRMKPL